MKTYECPYCGRDELKPYKSFYCCYGCGRFVTSDLYKKYMEIKEPEYICPHCGYEMLDENEAEGAVDCGCPSCRCIIDWESIGNGLSGEKFSC